MAIKTARQAGLYSDPNTWTALAVPGATDTPDANNFIVEINDARTVSTLRSRGSAGYFNLTAGCVLTVTDYTDLSAETGFIFKSNDIKCRYNNHKKHFLFLSLLYQVN